MIYKHTANKGIRKNIVSGKSCLASSNIEKIRTSKTINILNVQKYVISQKPKYNGHCNRVGYILKNENFYSMSMPIV
jgi:hypothetical protein